MTDFRIITPKDFIVHGWSGGTTSEIFLYPEGSDYKDKSFEVRISSADITIDGTPYSDFSGYTRLICPIKGTMDIHHKSHHSCKLNSFEVDRFDGSWLTQSYGQCTDFNLLFSQNWEGDMKKVLAPAKLTLPCDQYHGFFSCSDKSLEINIKTSQLNQTIKLDSNAFLLIFSDEETGLEIRGKTSPLVYVNFWLR